MRIVHVVHQYYPEHVGGTESHTRALALAQVAAGHEVTVFTRRFGEGQRVERDDAGGVSVVRAVSGPFSPTGRFRDTLREPFLAECLRRLVADTRPEILHVQHLMGLPVGALSTDDGEGPIVATLHDYWWVCANAQLYTSFDRSVCDGPRAWLNCAQCGLARVGAHLTWPLAPVAAPAFALRGLALRRFAGRVTRWIAPTEFVRRWHVQRGFPADRTVTIGHGIEPPPPEAVAARAVAAPGPARRFAYLGGLSEQKGVHLLVDAFAGMPADAELLIAGDASVFPGYCADLRQRARHPGVAFVGLLDQAAVWRTLATVDVVVVPSLWYETSSLILQEAFAVGAPVVAAEHGALAERVRHEGDGLLVAPGDTASLSAALQRLANEPALLPRLRAGIRPVRTIAEYAAAIEDVYSVAIDTYRHNRRG